MLSSISSLLRLASILICLAVFASFAIFAIDQTSARTRSVQEQLSSGAAVAAGPATSEAAKAQSTPKGEFQRTIEDASKELTSPFSGITAGSNSEWAIRGVDLVLALIVYGFGLGYLARVLVVRT
jgi:hypothetical protein